jgi:hypothetical protein
MEIIENKKLSELLNKTVGVDTDTGMIVISENDEIIDITNHILELVTIAIEDSQVFIGLNRQIRITVENITNG